MVDLQSSGNFSVEKDLLAGFVVSAIGRVQMKPYFVLKSAVGKQTWIALLLLSNRLRASPLRVWREDVVDKVTREMSDHVPTQWPSVFNPVQPSSIQFLTYMRCLMRLTMIAWRQSKSILDWNANRHSTNQIFSHLLNCLIVLCQKISKIENLKHVPTGIVIVPRKGSLKNKK
eukprot:gene10175-2336_t